MAEDHQEEQSLLDFVSVVATLQSLNELPEAPSESRNICGFCAALENDDQPASSYRLLVGRASGDILSDIGDHISSPSSGMCRRKCRSFLPIRRFAAVGSIGLKVRNWPGPAL